MLTTDGKRIYAIGDIHGCLDEMTRVMADVHRDLAARPHPDPIVVFLGDYTDRGPDSRGVIEALLALGADPLPTIFLMGNHDQRFLAYLDDPAPMTTQKYHWLHQAIGGMQTMASYGVDGGDPERPGLTHAAFRKAVPPEHVEFLRGTALSHRVGSYLFVHAGIRPGVPLAEQDPEDLIWIRDPFLHNRDPHGFIVVHGHTPVDRIELHSNRIAIDTGAVFGRHLSCIALEGDSQQELDGRTLLPLGP